MSRGLWFCWVGVEVVSGALHLFSYWVGTAFLNVYLWKRINRSVCLEVLDTGRLSGESTLYRPTFWAAQHQDWSGASHCYLVRCSFAPDVLLVWNSLLLTSQLSRCIHANSTYSPTFSPHLMTLTTRVRHPPPPLRRRRRARLPRRRLWNRPRSRNVRKFSCVIYFMRRQGKVGDTWCVVGIEVYLYGSAICME